MAEDPQDRPRGPRKSKRTPPDMALWDKVAETVAPLPKRRRAKPAARPTPEPRFQPPLEPSPAAAAAQPKPAPPQSEQKKKPKPTIVKPTGPTAPAAPKVQAPRRPASAIDRRAKRRLASGQIEIDDAIDLHGMTQAQAHTALKQFLVRAQADGARYVLVITGKGAPEASDTALWGKAPRGILRKRLPEWCAAADLSSIVLAVDGAHQRHGGDGAFYLRLLPPKQ